MSPDRPFMLDVTRLIARSWSRRFATGIDRVCAAYLDHFADRAQAVVQYRGVFRVLNAAQSSTLFDLLRGPDHAFRQGLLRLSPRVLTMGASRVAGGGAIYLNVSHTDFDLEAHWHWARMNDVRPVYLIHDLIPINHATYCQPHATRRHLARVAKALRSAAGIVVNSQATSTDLARFVRREGGMLPPVLVAPLAGARLQPEGRRAFVHRPYFLCVGTIEPRKNHRLLFDLWQRLAARSDARVPALLCIGQWGAGSEPVRQQLESDPLLRQHVTVLSDCADGALADWITGAEAVLLPSLAEGFGLPLVEALGLGTPVIASDLPCFRENGQGLALLLDPHKVTEWEAAVTGLLADPATRERQRQRARQFRPPSWEAHFARLDDWLTSEVLAESAQADDLARRATVPVPERNPRALAAIPAPVRSKVV